MAKKEENISYQERLKIAKEIASIEKKIADGVNIQASTRKKYNELLDKSFKIYSETFDLDKKLNKLKDTAFGKIKKELGLEKQLAALEVAKEEGSLQNIKNAGKLTDLMEEVASGSKDFATALGEIADEDFGAFNNAAAEFGRAIRNGGEDLEKNIKRGKQFSDTFDGILQSITGINFAELFTTAGALAALQQFVSSTFEIRQSLGTSVMESARLAGNVKSAAISAKLLGGSSKEAEDAVTGLVDEFGSLSVVSLQTSINLGRLVATTGITGKNAAALLKQLEAINGASLETNINLLSSVSSLARAEGVAPAQVLNSIAEDTKAFAEFAKDGGMNLARAAIEARKLGLNLKDVTTIADNLLDFESSITQEMEASLLIGRQLSLDTARRLALEGDMVGLMEEVKRQVGGQAEFESMNVVQRRELAKAIGIGADDLAKIVAGEKTSAQLAEEKLQREKQFLNLQKAAATAQIATAIASIFAGYGKFGPLGLIGAGAAVAGMYALLPKLEKGGVVKETGMAVVHKGEVFSGTRNEMGMGNTKTNQLLRELITQNEFLMNRLTNRVGDMALSNAV